MTELWYKGLSEKPGHTKPCISIDDLTIVRASTVVQTAAAYLIVAVLNKS